MASSSEKYQCSLTAELQQKAEKELNEKEKRREQDIQALRDMVLLHRGIVLVSSVVMCKTKQMI